MNFFKDHLNLSNNIYDNAQILKAAEIKKQQEGIDRNPTTKYYQTLAQNLQEQVNNLKKKMLSEAGIVPPTPGIAPPAPVLPGYNPATPPYPGITPVAPTPTPTPAPTAPTAPGPRSPNTPPKYNPDDPFAPGERWTGEDGTTWQWDGKKGKWYILSRPTAPRSPQTPRKGGGYYPSNR